MSSTIRLKKSELRQLISELSVLRTPGLLLEVGAFTFFSAVGEFASVGQAIIGQFARAQAGSIIVSMNTATQAAMAGGSWAETSMILNHTIKRLATSNAGNAKRAADVAKALNNASKGANGIQFYVGESGNVAWRLQQAASTISSGGAIGLAAMGSMILGTLMVVGLGIESLVTQGTFKRSITNAKKIAQKKYLGEDGSYQLFRQQPSEKIHSMLTTIDSKKPIGQAVLSAIPYILDVPEKGVPTIRSSAQTPPGVETPADAAHISNGNDLIALINDGELDGDNIIQGYITNFLRPGKKAARAAAAKIDAEIEKENASLSKEKGGKKGGEAKLSSTAPTDKLSNYAKKGKVQNAIVEAMRSAAKQAGGSFRIESLGKDFKADYSSFVSLYKALKADKNQNPEGGDISPIQMANMFREVLPKKYDEANKILSTVSGAGSSENLNESRYKLKLRY